MSYLVDIMLGISITAFIVKLAFNSYTNCKKHAQTTSVHQTVLIKLNMDDTVPDNEIPEGVRKEFNNFLQYKVVKEEIDLKQIDISKMKLGLGRNYRFTFTDIDNQVIDPKQKQGKAYLWIAEETNS